MSGPLGHILIVEDDRQLSGQLDELLEHAGYGVQCCGDGSAGL
ncbi:MAG: hypothetical protein VX301_10355 [Pseudomonadota bacterium]|nr:hypothetical protein [Pseudomonadota bacterium]